MAYMSSWPAAVVLEIMACLRRHDRLSLAYAAPLFWEAQEVQCFHEKTLGAISAIAQHVPLRIGPDEDVIGIGVCAQGRGRLAKLTAFFDAVSQTAWEGGLRRAATRLLCSLLSYRQEVVRVLENVENQMKLHQMLPSPEGSLLLVVRQQWGQV
eukprot:s9590_g3.t1